MPRRGRLEEKERQWTSRFDVFTEMAFSNIVMFAIIVPTTATLGRNHHVTIDSAAQAASSLRPVAGRFGSAISAYWPCAGPGGV
jgi:Mn2+/Fe2+ NRAMP family transporter